MPHYRALRVGRKVGRTLYEQLGEQPSDDDPLVGVMDTIELAMEVVHVRQQLEGAVKALKKIALTRPNDWNDGRVPTLSAREANRVAREALDALGGQ